MNLPTDTSPEAERLLIEIYRRMSADQKWRQLGAAYRTAKTLHASGVLANHPSATADEIHESWVAVTLGRPVLKALQEAGHGPKR